LERDDKMKIYQKLAATFLAIAALIAFFGYLVIVNTYVNGSLPIIRTNIYFVSLFLMGFSLCVALFLSRVFSRPIINLTNAVNEISRGNLKTRLDIRSNDELGQLGRAFNAMADNLSRTQVSKENIERIINSMSDTLVIVNCNGTIEDVNQATLELLGYEKEELIGKPVGKVFAQDESLFSKVWIQNLIKLGIVRDQEKTYVAKDGKKIPMLFSGSVIYDDAGPKGVVCLAVNISERKAAEEKVKESEERLKDLFDNANDLIQSVDAEGRFTYVNKSWMELLGYSEEEVKKMSFADVVRKDQLKHCMSIFNDVKKGRTYDNVETVFVTKSGQEIYVEGNINGRFKDSQFVSTRGIFRDVTERRKSQETKRLKSFFESISYSIMSAIIVIDRDKNIQSWNDYAEKIWGVKPENAIGKNIMKMNFGSGRLDGIKYDVQSITETKETHISTDVFIKTASNEEKYIDLAYSPILNEKNDVEGVVVFAYDITDRIKLQESIKRKNLELQRAVDKLRELDKMKTEFLNMTSHELKTPLTPMRTQLELLVDNRLGKLNSKQKESIDMIHKNIVRLTKLVNDILSLSRIQGRKLELNFQEASIEEVVSEVIENTDEFAKKKKVRIIKSIDNVQKFLFDRDKIIEVLLNLVHNAIKFTPENGEIEVCVKKQKGEVVVSVKDNGVGISKEKSRNLFTPFYQADSSQSRQVGGTGLGLSICKGIVELHGGEIWVESTEGKGSTFFFTIPIKSKNK
jgi:PAS domain S-box-containing protein